MGFVHLRGRITTSSETGNAAFTLPIGYRPLLPDQFINSAVSTNPIRVNYDGSIVLVTAGTAMNLAGIIFMGEQ